MLLVSGFLDSIIADMIANTDWLAKVSLTASDLAIVPVVAPFTPAPASALGDFALAPAGLFDNDYIRLGSPTQSAVVNADNSPGIKLTEPLGGFTFVVADPTVLPGAKVYGFLLVTLGGVSAPTDLVAMGVLDTPIDAALVGFPIQSSSILGFFAPPVLDPVTAVVPNP